MKKFNYEAWLGLCQQAMGCMAWIHGYTTVTIHVIKLYLIKSTEITLQ